jgi:hypothetical protein
MKSGFASRSDLLLSVTSGQRSSSAAAIGEHGCGRVGLVVDDRNSAQLHFTLLEGLQKHWRKYVELVEGESSYRNFC